MLMFDEIIEISGPPLPYIESTGLNGEPSNDFRSFAFISRDPGKAIRAADKKISEIKKELILRSNWPNCTEKPIIVWRTRPSLELAINDQNSCVGFKARFRLTTIPDLTEEQWADLNYKKQGEPASEVD